MAIPEWWGRSPGLNHYHLALRTIEKTYILKVDQLVDQSECYGRWHLNMRSRRSNSTNYGTTERLSHVKPNLRNDNASLAGAKFGPTVAATPDEHCASTVSRNMSHRWGTQKMMTTSTSRRKLSTKAFYKNADIDIHKQLYISIIFYNRFPVHWKKNEVKIPSGCGITNIRANNTKKQNSN